MSDTEFKLDEALRRRTQELLDAREWSQSEGAKAFHLTSATRLGKYLQLGDGRAPEKDMPQVQTAIRNWFRHQDRRDQATANLFENHVSKDIFGWLKQIRRTGQISVIHGPAGLGKTSAIGLFCQEHPNTVSFTVTRWERSSRAMENLIADQIGGEGYDCSKGIKRAQWMVTELRGSERLIIVDQAHRLHFSGAEYLFDFHDATGCPIALVGNIGVLDVVRASDQMTSRIGAVHQVKPRDDYKDVAKKLIEQYAPGANGELLEEAAGMLSQSGHARALRQRLTIATDLYEDAKGAGKDWTRVFAVAGQKLVKPSGRPIRNR